jgi:hypothetical protein
VDKAVANNQNQVDPCLHSPDKDLKLISLVLDNQGKLLPQKMESKRSIGDIFIVESAV